MPGITSLLPDGWERSETTNGILYYINHETETTQWDHPEMISLMEEIEGLSNIKYAAYRTAMKLRTIQKKTQLYLVDLRVAKASLVEEGIKDGYIEGNLSTAEVHKIITAIFINQTGNRNSQLIDVSLASELVLNWILNVYDPGRMGFVPILSLKVGLAVMSSEKVQEKYRYLFSQFSNNHGFLDSKRLKLFLQEMLQIPKHIYESASFSGSSVEPAVRNCLEGVSIPERVSFEEFIEWMIAEPQTIVWLPTLHRLAVSETVKHEAKCNVCKMYPIVGFRYRCLKCFNFDLCQGCFWSGRVSKQHKIGHPTQEYCLVSTQKEDIKDFAKVMRNKVSKKKKKKTPEHSSKGRFIPIDMEDAAPSEGEYEDSVDAGSAVKAFPGTHDKLESYAARLANHEVKEEEQVTREDPAMTRLAMGDEHHPVQQYAKCLTREPDVMGGSPSPTDMMKDLAVSNQEKQDLEHLITTLESDNRALQSQINSIHQLHQHSQTEQSITPLGDLTKEAHLRRQRERLEAREEVLEEHNYQLQVQVHRLRTLLQQDDLTLSGLVGEEKKMAAVFALNRLGKGDPSVPTSLEPFVQPTSTLSVDVTKNTPIRPSETRTTFEVPKTAFSSVTSQSLQQKERSSLSNTFATPASLTPAYLPKLSLSPGISPSGMKTVPLKSTGEFGEALPTSQAPSLDWPFVSSTATELGLVDRPDTSYEGLQLSSIVDRITDSFPLVVNSDVAMDVHNDLFVSASLVGEAMLSIVSTVARNTDGATNSGVSPARTSNRNFKTPASFKQL
ncbi:dystrophin-like isoform X1 [Acropora palmata]